MPTRTSPVASTTWLLCSCRVSPSIPASPQARFWRLFSITYLLGRWRTYWPCGPQTRKITLQWNCRMGRSGSSQDVAGLGGRTRHVWAMSPVAMGSTAPALMAMCMIKAKGEILWWKDWTWSATGNGMHTWSSPYLYLAWYWDQLLLATFLTGKNEIFSTVAWCRIRFSVWFPGGTEHHVQSPSSFHTPSLKCTLLLALRLGVQCSTALDDSLSGLPGHGCCACCRSEVLAGKTGSLTCFKILVYKLSPSPAPITSPRPPKVFLKREIQKKLLGTDSHLMDNGYFFVYFSLK